MADGGGWTAIEHRFIALYGPRLGAIGIALYVTLKSHLNTTTRQCNPSHRRLAKELRLGRNTVKAHLQRLRDEAKVVAWTEALTRVNACYVTHPQRRPTTWQEAAAAMRYGIQVPIDDAHVDQRRLKDRPQVTNV
jgi:hypothetical protein